MHVFSDEGSEVNGVSGIVYVDGVAHDYGVVSGAQGQRDGVSVSGAQS